MPALKLDGGQLATRSYHELRKQRDVKAVPAQAIGAELVSARAQDQFLTALKADDRQPCHQHMVVEVHDFYLQKRTRRAAGLSFNGKRRAPGATAIWMASPVPSM